MKKQTFSISYYILIAVIFGGISLLSALAAYHLTMYAVSRNIEPALPLFYLSVAVVAVTALCSYLVLSVILTPIAKFVRAAEKLPIMAQASGAEAQTGQEHQQIEHIHDVLDQVAEILGNMEAQEHFPEIVGQSRVMRALFGQIIKAAPTDSTVLISGESGTGKELVATAIYNHSLRRDKPFVKLNCVAIPEGLLESELFGHEKGAFTGAVAQKKGKFELADTGTIFLDVIGDMPSATQAKLLRVLQEKQFERVGGNKTIQVDIRVIAATNKNLPELIKIGAFREDLYYRLNVFSLHLPPLKERREDIPLLIERMIEQTGKDLQVSPAAMQRLIGCDWPGNVRELQNVIERAAVFADKTIEAAHLPTSLTAELLSADGGYEHAGSLDERLAEIEKGMIIEAINRAGGIQARAARFLGINPRSLWHRIKKYQIDVVTIKTP